jgi:hypothetical protein
VFLAPPPPEPPELGATVEFLLGFDPPLPPPIEVTVVIPVPEITELLPLLAVPL